MISGGANLPEVLEDVCRGIEGHAPDILASVLLADQEGGRLWPAAGSRIPATLTEAINPLPLAQFPMSPMVVSDVATDPLFSGTGVVSFRDIALGHGFRAVWFYPLLSKAQVVLGTLALYCTARRSPSDGELDLITGARHLAVLAIEKSLADAALKGVLEDSIRNENQALREEIDGSSMFEQIVGSSRALKRVLAQVAKVAQSDSTVLITGETGTGKELLARAIHKTSKRSGRAFVRVNCAAIPPSLIASELFGHEKGRSPARSSDGLAVSSWPMVERSSSTRWASCRQRPRSLSSGSCKKESSSASGAPSRFRSTCACSPRRTASSRLRSSPESFGVTSTID
jgi:hypothetical protein